MAITRAKDCQSRRRYSPPTQAPTQSSQPQQELVKQGSQNENPPQSASFEQACAHVRLLKLHTPTPQPSFASQRSGVIGVHADRQSAHEGQLDVAQSLQTVPTVHPSQRSEPHVSAHVPDENTQS